VREVTPDAEIRASGGREDDDTEDSRLSSGEKKFS